MEPFGKAASNRLDLKTEEKSDFFLFSGYQWATAKQ